MTIVTVKRSFPWKETMVFLLLGLAFIILKTTLISRIDPRGYGPDLVLILTIFLGLSSFTSAGPFLVIFFGLLVDLASGGPRGIFTGVYLINFGIAVLIRRRLDPAAPTYQIMIVFLLALLSECLVWSVLSLGGQPADNLISTIAWTHLKVHLSSILSAALISPILFWCFNYLGPFEDGQWGVGT